VCVLFPSSFPSFVLSSFAVFALIPFLYLAGSVGLVVGMIKVSLVMRVYAFVDDKLVTMNRR